MWWREDNLLTRRFALQGNHMLQNDVGRYYIRRVLGIEAVVHFDIMLTTHLIFYSKQG